MEVKATVTFKDYVPETTQSIERAIEVATGKSLAVAERNIKANTPIRTGTLARSITSRKTGFGEGEIFTAPVTGGKEINYAIHVEYGTQHMAPRAMFRKGIAQSEEQISRIFAEETKKVVK